VRVVTRDDYVSAAAAYYEGKLALFGTTPGGVDWNSEASQRLRFDQLFRAVSPAWPSSIASVNDYGCGYGALSGYLEDRGFAGEYRGYDASSKMIEAAERLHGETRHRRFASDRQALPPADLTVASGIFNVKLHASDDSWLAYVLETISDLAAVSRRAFAFNVLTSYSDPERRRPDLFYADPRVLFDHCKTLSPFVALLHDYPLYEFTIGVFLGGPNQR
jgi:SAM-dependent methyltransferase